MEWLNKKTEHGYDSGNPFSSRTHYFPFFYIPVNQKKICFHYAQEFTCNKFHVVSPGFFALSTYMRKSFGLSRNEHNLPSLPHFHCSRTYPRGCRIRDPGQQWQALDWTMFSLQRSEKGVTWLWFLTCCICEHSVRETPMYNHFPQQIKKST